MALQDRLGNFARRGVNMDMEKFDQKNIVLDEIIINRRTHRKFNQEFPPEKDINSIITAGLCSFCYYGCW